MQATQHARETLEAVAKAGKLGPAGHGAKVIYAQTDSIFASFPAATMQQALQLGRLAGELVSAAFPPVMDLKFERVCQPFMMLHVNRYVMQTLHVGALSGAMMGAIVPWRARIVGMQHA